MFPPEREQGPSLPAYRSSPCSFNCVLGDATVLLVIDLSLHSTLIPRGPYLAPLTFAYEDIGVARSEAAAMERAWQAVRLGEICT